MPRTPFDPAIVDGEVPVDVGVPLLAAGDALAAGIATATADGRMPIAGRARYEALASAYQSLLRHHVAHAHGPTPRRRSASYVVHCFGESLRFNLELPQPADAGTSSELAIKGWCFDLRAQTMSLDIWVDELRCKCSSGLRRDDVGASYPTIAAAGSSGFEGRIELAPGPHFLSIRAKVEGEAEIVLHERVVTIADNRMRAVLEAPTLTRLRAGVVRFSGWCWHRDAPIATLTLRAAGQSALCRYGLPRDDVARSFPDVATSRRSGFVCEIDLAQSDADVALDAVLEDGRHARILLGADVRCRHALLDLPALAHTRERLARAVRVVGLARSWIRRRGRLPHLREWPVLARKAHAVLRPQVREGASALPRGWRPSPPHDPYDVWLHLNRFTGERARSLRERLAHHDAALPAISIVMPVYNPDRALLARAIASVQAQVAERWELCIADDASNDSAVRDHLAAESARDARIRWVARPVNGHISAATNSAAALATGEFLLFLDQDDELAPDALGEIALRLVKHADTDVLYTDDDKIDGAGRRYAPQFKPDWSPELLLSYMYMGHALVVRRSLFAELSGFRAGFDGSQDHDFALRASERARRIEHVPFVLYHWRAIPGSTAYDARAKPASFTAGERAVSESLARQGIVATVARPPWAVQGGIGVYAHEFADDGPRVSVIVPTRNQHAILRRCLDSLAATTYRNFEVIVVDNASDDAQTLAFLGSLTHRVVRIASPGGRFNYAHLNNQAAGSATGEFILFLNDDTEVRAPRWLSCMIGYAQLPGVGAVGARLLYADGRIQHAGVIHGLHDGLAGPAFKLQPGEDHGYLSYAIVARNYSAVSAACMLTRKDLFLRYGGFDEHHFGVAYNDVDYCYRLVEAGYRCVYAPGAELLHHEGYSRGFCDDPHEIVAFRRKYGSRRDPYYSPHLSLDDGRFAINPWHPPVPRGDRPLRALMCAFTLNWEGAPYQQLELTLGLRRAGGFDPIVYSPTDGPLRGEYERHGIAVHVAPNPLRHAETLAEYERGIAEFADWIRSLRVDVVYANTMESFFAVAAARKAGRPSLWNIHESEPWQSYFGNLANDVAARALDCFEYPYRVIFVAHATRERFLALDTKRHFMTIHNGLDLDRVQRLAAARPRVACRSRLGVADSDVVLLLVGTVCARKGQHDLVHALAGLAERQGARLRCFLVGDRRGAYSVALHELVAKAPAWLRMRIAVIPETDDVALYYRAADLFVCTSRVESYPRVILEAMAFGLPIISTPVFGIREQIRDGINGLFYEPGDIPALRSRIVRLLEDEVLRARLAANARVVLDGLTDFDEMTARYRAAFYEAAGLES